MTIRKQLETIAEYIISARFHARHGSHTAALVDAEAAAHRLNSLLATHPLPESGQQKQSSPTDGQQTCLAQTATHATQHPLPCTDAHQSLFNSNGN